MTLDPSRNIVTVTDVAFQRGERTILTGINWRVQSGERWVVLGPNGGGKSTLLKLLALVEHPSSGTIDVLGERLGRMDVRAMRRRIGYASQGFSDQLRLDLTAEDIVVTAINAALEPWWHSYSEQQRAQARRCLNRMGVGSRAEQRFGSLSSGERQRVLIARTLMTSPDLVVLDEPFVGLDLLAREDLVDALHGLTGDRALSALVMVTHHLEEVPSGVTHVLGVRDAKICFEGPIEKAFSNEVLSEIFGCELEVHRGVDGRFSARARR